MTPFERCSERHSLWQAGFDLNRYIERQLQRVNTWLDEFTPREGSPASLYESLRYSVYAGGKRFRPLLAIAVCEMLGGDIELVAPLCVALEWIHTYSLIHDDLPCMDDDNLRRGRPTNHVVYGEAIALLAGDALLTEAFGLIARGRLDSALTPSQRVEAIECLSKAAGLLGMVGGQAADLEAEGRNLTISELESIHLRKTGALLQSSACMGVIASNGTEDDRDKVMDYALHLGIAFQIADDILDVVGDTDRIGKPIGSDEKNGKSTYPRLYGIEGSRRKAAEHAWHACETLKPYGARANALVQLVYYVIDRDI